MSDGEIAQRFGVSRTAIRNQRLTHGLAAASKWSYASKRYNTDRNFFAQIDTPAKAYILGFIIADGSVHKNGKSVTVAIQKTDAALLRAIAAELGCAAPLGRKSPSVRDKGTPLAVLTLCGRKLVADLSALGVRHDKSYTATYPAIPEHLESHLVRGLWDGDGWVGERQFSLASTRELVEGVTSAVERHTGCRLRIRQAVNGKSCWYAQGSRRDRPVLQWMYSDVGLAMVRKAGAYWLYWS
jgi:hypothetical protein